MKKEVIFGAVLAAAVVVLISSSCASIPKGAQVVQGFDADKYLGTWYEIARLDHRFERGMDNVVAQYSLKENGKIRVLNSGYREKNQEWKSAEGVAKFRGDENKGALKVSFFGPFYSPYNVIALDDDYQYALVVGNSLKYLWILSREKTIPESVRENYLKLAADLGYDIDALIWVKHDKANPNVVAE